MMSVEEFYRGWELHGQLSRFGLAALGVLSAGSFGVTVYLSAGRWVRLTKTPVSLAMSSALASMSWFMAVEVGLRFFEWSPCYTWGSAGPYDYISTLMTYVSVLASPVGFIVMARAWASTSRRILWVQGVQLLAWLSAVFVALLFGLLV